MKHTLEINKLGPIDSCRLECSPFMALTGKQASGKSTIAKSLYYFRSVKDDIVKLAEQQALYTPLIPGSKADGRLSGRSDGSLRKSLEHHLRNKFLGVFGTSWSMPPDMQLTYHYTDECYISVGLRENRTLPDHDFVWVELSRNLRDFLDEQDGFLPPQLDSFSSQKQVLQAKLRDLFDDPFSAVFVPAGRSTLAVLSEQLSYIYGTMDDSQKRTLDYCTREYIERILKLKPEFADGLNGLLGKSARARSLPEDRLQLASQLVNQVLCGAYRSVNGEERIVIDESQYVKINYASSGQQESVWILNLLFYYLLQDQRILFIVEEPESHLFPESQKYITELMALVSNMGHSVIMTTHSPYVLGTLNNLLYASSLGDLNKEAVSAVIPSSIWLDSASFAAWFVRDGGIESGMIESSDIIETEKIDEISRTVNREFDELLRIETADREEEDTLAAQ